MCSRISLKDKIERGQGLVEYALLLILIALGVVVMLALFGQSVSDTYCRISFELSIATGTSGGCSAPRISLRPHSEGPSHLNLEAEVVDPDGDPDDPYGAIDRVEFYIDDTSSGPVQTEHHYRYCLSGNPSGLPCGNFDTSGLSPGDHVIIVIAYDDDGNSTTNKYNYRR